jgi:hypothetical protein
MMQVSNCPYHDCQRLCCFVPYKCQQISPVVARRPRKVVRHSIHERARREGVSGMNEPSNCGSSRSPLSNNGREYAGTDASLYCTFKLGPYQIGSANISKSRDSWQVSTTNASLRGLEYVCSQTLSENQFQNLMPRTISSCLPTRRGLSSQSSHGEFSTPFQSHHSWLEGPSAFSYVTRFTCPWRS